MSKRDWKLLAEDILECAGKIEKYIEGMRFEDFENDSKTIDAVVRNLEIIGEASKNIPEQIKERYKNVYWKALLDLETELSMNTSG